MSDLRKALEELVRLKDVIDGYDANDPELVRAMLDNADAMDAAWDAARLALQSPPAEDGYVRVPKEPTNDDTPTTDALDAILEAELDVAIRNDNTTLNDAFKIASRGMVRYGLLCAKLEESHTALMRAAGQASFCLRELLPDNPDAQMTVRMLATALRDGQDAKTAQEPDQQSPDRASEGGGLGNG